MNKKWMMLLLGVAVAGAAWWKFGNPDKRELKRTVTRIRDGVLSVGERVTDGLDHLAGVIEDVSKIVQAVSRTVETGLHRVA